MAGSRRARRGGARIDAGLDHVRATSRLFAVYAAISGIALVFPHRPRSWPLLLAVHLLVVMLGLGWGPAAKAAAAVAGRWPRVWEVLRDWYPLLLIPALYTELAVLNLAVYDGRYFDPAILRVEGAIFGQPSRDFARALPYLPLSELLHASYLSYYLIIYGPPLFLYLAGRRADFRRVVFGVMLAFFVHYVFFIYFPVQGPRYLFPAPGGVIAEGPMYRLAHRILEAGSARGAAFPSSHVGVSIAQTVMAARFLPPLAPLLGLLATLLALGAVYGGFHYATDATAGFLLGLAAALAAPAARRLLLRLRAGGTER